MMPYYILHLFLFMCETIVKEFILVFHRIMTIRMRRIYCDPHIVLLENYGKGGMNLENEY